MKRRRPRATRRPMPPTELNRWLRRRKASALVIALVVLLAIALIDRAGGVLPVADDYQKYHGQQFEVARVVDGDTIDLRVHDGDKPTTRVRLWGVDTPEAARPSQGRPAEPWADEATAYTRQRVEGRRVTLYLQDHRLRGRYGRVLAYVVLPDGGELNAELIEQGLSEADDRWSHEKAWFYEQLEAQARRAGVGMWSE